MSWSLSEAAGIVLVIATMLAPVVHAQDNYLVDSSLSQNDPAHRKFKTFPAEKSRRQGLPRKS